ncbi:hypothetical protein F0247_23560 [Vibrio crassostreae]|nr:hypothetical protein [Vibrio crassostreae]
MLLTSIAIWHGEQLIYCGMSGRQIEKSNHKPKFGLITRIQSHASGDLKLDSLTKEYIHQHLEFQYVVVDTSEGAYKQEDKARSSEILRQLPLLNPL